MDGYFCFATRRAAWEGAPPRPLTEPELLTSAIKRRDPTVSLTLHELLQVGEPIFPVGLDGVPGPAPEHLQARTRFFERSLLCATSGARWFHRGSGGDG
jgi:hypothetical protein